MLNVNIKKLIALRCLVINVSAQDDWTRSNVYLTVKQSTHLAALERY